MKLLVGFLIGYACGDIGYRVAGLFGFIISFAAALLIGYHVDRKWQS